MESDWREAMVVFHDEGAPAGRPGSPKRLQLRKQRTEQRRSELIDRLVKAGLESEVELPQATPLSSLMVKGSPRALEEIDKAPIVKEVMPISPDATLGLIDE